MTSWKCGVCGYVVAGVEPPASCPVCGAPASVFEEIETPSTEPAPESQKAPAATGADDSPPLNQYLAQWSRKEYENEEKFSTIQKLSLTGRSDISPMGTRRPFPGMETLLFRGAQFGRFPLDEQEKVSTRTVIGPTAAHPLTLGIPF